MQKLTRRLAILVLVLVLVGGPLTAQPLGNSVPAARSVVMVSVDGLMPDYYRRCDELGLHLPTFRWIMREGVYASGVVGVLPSVTYPSHTTLITGVPPRVHGIAGNEIFDPLGRSNGAWQWFADDVRAPSLVSAARARWLTTATIS